MKKKILFRADGNTNTGLGHLYRLLAVVEMLKSEYDFCFVMRETSTTVVIPSDYLKYKIPKNISGGTEPAWLARNFKSEEYVIIADGYDFNSEYQKQLKQEGYQLIYIDDLTHEHMYSDAVVNHALGLTSSNFSSEDYTEFYLGTSYAMLRPSFLEAAKERRDIENIDTAFVCFGGADALDLGSKAVEAVLLIEQIKSVHVVLGAAYLHTTITEIANQNQNVSLYRNLDEASLYNLMKQCNIAIGPSSTIVYELCSIKMPILSGYYVDNQKNIYDALLKAGAIYEGGNFAGYTVEDFKEKLESILHQDKIEGYIKAQQNLFDGQSRSNFLRILNNLQTTFREATANDMMLVYNWSNDALVRQNSYNSEPIPLENHRNWFEQKIKDANVLFLIALYDNKPAGIVRYEFEEDKTVVGVLVAREFRGKKLSASFLSESSKLYFKLKHLPIFAYIKEENKASIKAFESAGYSFYKKEKVIGSHSLIYKLRRNEIK